MAKRRSHAITAVRNYLKYTNRIIQLFEKKQGLKVIKDKQVSNSCYDFILNFDNGYYFSLEDIIDDLRYGAEKGELIRRQKEYLEMDYNDKFYDGFHMNEYRDFCLELRNNGGERISLSELIKNSPDKK